MNVATEIQISNIEIFFFSFSYPTPYVQKKIFSSRHFDIVGWMAGERARYIHIRLNDGHFKKMFSQRIFSDGWDVLRSALISFNSKTPRWTQYEYDFHKMWLREHWTLINNELQRPFPYLASVDARNHHFIRIPYIVNINIIISIVIYLSLSHVNS